MRNHHFQFSFLSLAAVTLTHLKDSWLNPDFLIDAFKIFSSVSSVASFFRLSILASVASFFWQRCYKELNYNLLGTMVMIKMRDFVSHVLLFLGVEQWSKKWLKGNSCRNDSFLSISMTRSVHNLQEEILVIRVPVTSSSYGLNLVVKALNFPRC